MQLSTGLPGLDRVLRGVMPGDNFVWQVESLADFAPFAAAFCEMAAAKNKKLIYFRFAKHEPSCGAGCEAGTSTTKSKSLTTTPRGSAASPLNP